jgi:hypothetical protein
MCILLPKFFHFPNRQNEKIKHVYLYGHKVAIERLYLLSIVILFENWWITAYGNVPRLGHCCQRGLQVKYGNEGKTVYGLRDKYGDELKTPESVFPNPTETSLYL